MMPAIASITTHIVSLNRYVKKHRSSQQLCSTSHLSVPPATPPSSNPPNRFTQHPAAPQHPASHTSPATTPLQAQPPPSPPALVTSTSHIVSASQPPAVSIAHPFNFSSSASQPCMTHTHLQHVQSSSPRSLRSNSLPKNYRSLK